MAAVEIFASIKRLNIGKKVKFSLLSSSTSKALSLCSLLSCDILWNRLRYLFMFHIYRSNKGMICCFPPFKSLAFASRIIKGNSQKDGSRKKLIKRMRRNSRMEFFISSVDGDVLKHRKPSARGKYVRECYGINNNFQYYWHNWIKIDFHSEKAFLEVILVATSDCRIVSGLERNWVFRQHMWT